MTTKTQKQLLGQRGRISTERNQLWIEVTIQDARSSYGRQEVLVKPESGSGKAWVCIRRVNLYGGPAIPLGTYCK
jgi:hypothetical protein